MKEKITYNRKDVEEIITTTQKTARQRTAKTILEETYVWVGLVFNLYPHLSKSEFVDKIKQHIKELGTGEPYHVWEED